MRRINLAVALLLFGFIGVARGSLTGNELYAHLQSKDAHETLRAYGYIEGVLDTEELYVISDTFASYDAKSKKLGTFKFEHLCFGSTVTQGQIRDIVLKYLAANPGTRHFPAMSLIRAALMEGFACPNNPAKSAPK